MSARSALWVSVGCVVLTLALATQSAAQEATPHAASEPINLLRWESVELVRSTASIGRDATLPNLTDGKTETLTETDAEATAPLDIVYGFRAQTVTAERIVVRLPRRAPGEVGAGKIEILVSMTSPQAGFRSVRVDPLRPTTDAQEFKFRPAGAKWIMLRITPWKERTDLAVAEVEVWGRPGAPAATYAFNQSPAKAVEVLQRLKKISAVDVALSKEEQALSADAVDGKFDQMTFAEAALSTSVSDPARRKAHLARIEQLVVEGKAIVATGKTPFEQGEKLLKWLHREAILKKYVALQTDLGATLDTGQYNCVSSAILFAVIGRRLGLDVRAIEAPDHAFAVVYDGTQHADVETTTPVGFNPARDKRGQAEFEKLTGFRYIPDKRDQRREITETGLVAICHYNHGVSETHKKRYASAMADYFRALSLDPENASAVKNTLVSLQAWCHELATTGKFQEALDVIAAAIDLAPQDPSFTHNQNAVWEMWAANLMKAGKFSEALAVLRKAAAALPQGGFDALQTMVYIEPAEEKAKQKDWAAALAIVDPALQQFQDPQFGSQRTEIQNYQTSLFTRWSNQEIAAKRYPEAAKVLEQALGKLPGQRTLAHNLAYVAQEWARQTAAKEGAAKGDALVLDLVKRHPTLTDLKEVALNRLRRAIDEQLKAGKYEGAVAAAGGLSKVVDDPALVEELTAHVYNAWAITKLEAKDWAAAVEIFGKGRKAAPKSETLEKNEEIAWHQWTHALLKAQDWPQAVKVFAQARERLPKDEALENNERVAWSRLAASQGDKQEFTAALTTMAAARERFPKDEALADQEVYFWQKRCEPHFQAKEWSKAVEVLQLARKRFPEQKTLAQNEAISWINWSAALAEKKDWAMAVKVLEQAVKRFPEDDQLLENLKICRENLDN